MSNESVEFHSYEEGGFEITGSVDEDEELNIEISGEKVEVIFEPWIKQLYGKEIEELDIVIKAPKHIMESITVDASNNKFRIVYNEGTK